MVYYWLDEINKKYEGKYFRHRNGYNEKDRWWRYIKVTQIKPSDIYDTKGNGITSHYHGWYFETTTEGMFIVSKEKYGYIHLLGTEISKKEFYSAYNSAIKKLPD